MNRGLTKYTKQIQENVNNVIINVNLNEEDNKNHIYNYFYSDFNLFNQKINL